MTQVSSSADVPSMGRRQFMNLLTFGTVTGVALGVLYPLINYFIPPSAGGGGGGVTAKDALGNDIVVSNYLTTHLPGDRALAQGLKGDPTYVVVQDDGSIANFTDNAKPGETFSIAILGINGAIGKEPENYIWIRNATLDFYKEKYNNPDWKNIGKIFTIDEKLNSIIVPNTSVEKLADGFSFTEGPVWHPDGYLLFSDPNTNTIYRYNPKNSNVTIYMSHSGYTGADIGDYHQPGSNGLAIDDEGRLLINQNGNRRVIRIEKKGPVNVLADKIDGKRFNRDRKSVV